MTIPTQNALEALLESGSLPATQQEVGARLLARLTSDVEVVLAGPLEATKTQLAAAFQAHKLARAHVRVLPWPQQEPIRGDLCIWCTTGFDEEEQNRWTDAPERLKDHSFLVPVLPDSFAAGDLQRLEGIAEQEFFGFLPVPYDESLSQIPGKNLRALLQEVQRSVESGCAADEDHAQMFLSQHDPSHARVVPAQDPGDGPAQGSPFASALHIMQQHIEDLAGVMEPQTDDDCDMILTLCSEAAEAVTDFFQTSGGASEVSEAFLEDLQSATDRVVLLSLEGGVTPTLMAVTTVLQMRRELETRIAA